MVVDGGLEEVGVGFEPGGGEGGLVGLWRDRRREIEGIPFGDVERVCEGRAGGAVFGWLL